MTTVLLSRGTTFGEFRATGFVGSGGFSDVYEARDSKGRRVALKVLRLQSLASGDQQIRIQRERLAISLVDSRGIARLIDADLQAEQPWIASEFIDGPTLRESIDKSGPLEYLAAMALAKRLAEILVDVHQQGIAHRDITPNNIVFGPDGPVIIDFGSARIDLDSEITGSVLVYGTSGYAPPEISTGQPVGRSADVYGLARTIQFCLSGSDEGQADLPPILERCLSTDPVNRPPAGEVVQVLGPQGEIPRRNSPKLISKLPRRFKLRSLLVATGLAIGLSVLATVSLLSPNKTPSTQDLLGLTASDSKETPTSAQLVSLLDAPATWETYRIRPRDSIFVGRPGDLSTLQFRHWDPSDSEGKPLTSGEVLITYASQSDVELFGTQNAKGQALTRGLQSVADEVVDLVETQNLPNGCTFTRASEYFSISDSLNVWAATAERCAGEEERFYAVGIAWDTTSDLLGKWYVSSSEKGAIKTFIEALHISPDVSIRSSRQARSGNLVPAESSTIDFVNSDGPSDSLAFHVAAVRLLPGEAIRLRNFRDTSLQISAYFQKAQPSYEDLFWWAGGRWWARETGELRIFGNPFDEEVIFFFEIEATDTSQQMDLRFTFQKSQSSLITLEESLGEQLSAFVTLDVLESENEFLLPDNPPESADAASYPVSFLSGTTRLTFKTALIPYTKVAKTPEMKDSALIDQSLIVRADDTLTVTEFGYVEVQDPHWMIALADLAEVFYVREALYWSQSWDANGCLQSAEWVVPTSVGRLYIYGVLGCRIKDSFNDVDSFIQSVPIYRFALEAEENKPSVLVGSFVPESLYELASFQTFLQQLVDQAAGFDYENSLVTGG